MKLKTPLTLLFLCIFLQGWSQNAYYAALAIRAKCVTGSGATFKFKIDTASQNILASNLRSVFPDTFQSKFPKASQVFDEYVGNPFFGSQIDTLTNSTQEGANASSFFSLPSGIGGFNVTNIADGIAQFLVERAKEELFVSFVEKLQDFLANKAPELDTLFPNTLVLLNNFKSWEYSNMLTTLRASVDKDLQQMLGDLIKLRNIDATKITDATVKKRVEKLEQFFASDNGRILMSLFYAGNGFINGQKTPDVIHTVATDPSYLQGVTLLTSSEKSSIRLLDIVSTSLESVDANRNYIPVDSLKQLYTDPVLQRLFLGMVYEQIKDNKVVIGGVTVTALLDTNHVNGIETYITQLVTQGEAVHAAIDSLKNAKKKGVKDLSSYWEGILQSSNEFLTAGSNISVIDPSLKFSPNVQKYIASVEQVFGIGQDIAIKNYNAAVVGTLTLVNSYLDANSNVGELLASFAKYVSFAGNLVAAQSADDAKNAIEAVALPVGSASIKKNSHFNIALNAYLGGFWGNEYIPALQSGQWSPIAGVTAPIGITFSKPLMFDNCSWGSASLFISLIDVGAFASFRLSDTTTAKLPKVTLENIWAPGFGLVWGLPKIPLSIGYTYQWGPDLREINANTATVSTNSLNHRWSFFLAVDIPILNLYTKSK